MPHFKGLEQYLDYSNILLKGSDYANETTKVSKVGYAAIKQLVARDLKKAVKNANDFKNKGLQTTDVSGNMSIKDRAKFFEENTPQKRMAKQNELNDKVIYYRKWLSRQGAIFKGEDDIDHFQAKTRVVAYDTDLARQGATRISIRGGRLYFGAVGGKPATTKKMVTHFSGPGKGIYVFSKQGHLHVASHKVGKYHHSSLLAGRPVACAGELEIDDLGKLLWISNKSGHYLPQRDDLLHVLACLQEAGVEMLFKVSCRNASGETNYNNVEEFLSDYSLDNKSIDDLAKYLYEGGGGGGGGNDLTYGGAY